MLQLTEISLSTLDKEFDHCGVPIIAGPDSYQFLKNVMIFNIDVLWI